MFQNFRQVANYEDIYILNKLTSFVLRLDFALLVFKEYLKL